MVQQQPLYWHTQSITGHKVQGQSILKPLTVAYDLKGIFEEAQGYVMLSRVEHLDQNLHHRQI